ncbi:unnamed protein product [Paramecium sonneborni]|uniref:Uncharacterized protein n=1 Tax=Paramecium sonneborni TaxID=65129 RepID=A0A8S1RU42_9CILI|nr:unnamed protein product [Paramecium sonneborni]
MSLIQAFPITSKGGNGLIIANTISIDKTSVYNSFSLYGGCFFSSSRYCHQDNIQQYLISCIIIQYRYYPYLELKLFQYINQFINFNHSFEVQGLNFDSIIFVSCEYGILRIKGIIQSQIENILFNNISIFNCQCGQTRCFSLIQSEDESFLRSDLLLPNRRIFQKYDYTKLIQKLENQARIVNRRFVNNNVTYGGSLLTVKKKIQQFIIVYFNRGEIGGAIYFYSNEFSMMIFNSQIIENEVSIAGGLYLNKQQLQETFLLEIFLSDNNSTFFGSDIFENPISLTISVDGGKRKSNHDCQKKRQSHLIRFWVHLNKQNIQLLLLVDKYFLTNTLIYFNRSISHIIQHFVLSHLTNIINSQEKKLGGSTCTLTPIIIKTSNEETIQGLVGYLSYNNVKFNDNTGDYNLDDLIIYFNPTYKNDIVLRLNIQIIQQIIIYQQISRLSNVNQENYATSGGCILCDVSQGQYQVKQDVLSCNYKDDQKIKSIKSSMIELRQNYWIAYQYYYNLIENCEGGWLTGDESCIIRHIGALCEIWVILFKFYIYSCGSCQEISRNVLTIVFISILILISILISVSSTVEMIENLLLELDQNHQDTFQLQVSSGLTSVVNNVGNPIESMAYLLDCFLINFSDILIIYFKVIWILIMVSSYLTVFFTLGGIAILLNSIRFRFSYIATALIYVFIQMQPTFIESLISLISYRVILDEYWIQDNVAYRYDTYQHFKRLLGFCFPLLLFFGVIMPVYFWYGIRKNPHHKFWGYLYNEYKLHAYYWETIKILQKDLIIIILAYYQDHIPIKHPLHFQYYLDIVFQLLFKNLIFQVISITQTPNQLLLVLYQSHQPVLFTQLNNQIYRKEFGHSIQLLGFQMLQAKFYFIIILDFSIIFQYSLFLYLLLFILFIKATI